MSAISSVRSAALVWLFLFPACAKYGQPTTLSLESSPEKVRSTSPPTAVLERREIASFDGLSLGAAVEQLRPDWLRHGASTHVNGESATQALYVNDVASGDVSGLRSIPAEVVIDVRLLSQSEAWARFGPSCRCTAGAILVRTRMTK